MFGEVITGINFLRDFGAGIRNIVGGRSEGYEQELLQTRNEALQELEQRAAPWARTPWWAWTWITRCWVKATCLW